MVTRCREDRQDVLYVSYHIVENSVQNQAFQSDPTAFDVPGEKTYNL